MPIPLTCPQCGKTVSIRDEAAGKQIRCSCGKTILVPSASDVRPTPPIAQPKPAAATTSPAIAENPAGPKRSSLPLILGGCGIALVLLLVFGATVGLVVYALLKPGDASESKQAAASVTEEDKREAPRPAPVVDRGPRVRDDRGHDVPPPPPDRPTPDRPAGDRPTPDRPTPDRRPPDRPASASEDNPEVLTKSLAAMDKLTIAVAPPMPEDKPTPEVWDGHTATIRGVAYNHDGTLVVSVSGAIQKEDRQKKDNSIRVWDARRGRQIRKLDDFREALDAVSVSPGGRFAVFGHGGHYEGDKWVDADDHHVRLWDIQTNKELYFQKGGDEPGKSEALFRGLASSVFSTAFSPDRNKVVGVDNKGTAVLWEAQTGKLLVKGDIKAVARPRSDGKSILPIRFTLTGTNCIRFTPDNRWLLTAGGDYTVRLFDATTGQQVHSFESHQDIVWAVATARTRDGRLLGLSGGGSRMKLDFDGFEAGARDYAIRLWDLDARREIRRFTGSEQDVLTLVFSPNGRHFLSAGQDKTVRLWDIASGKQLRTYRGHTDMIRSISIAPDGRTAVSGSDDCTIRYWRLPATAEDVMLALDKKKRDDLTAAMRDLDTMGPELRAAFPKLVRTLGENDKALAELALTLLRGLGQPDKEWINGLGELLASPLPAARLFAAESLVRVASDALPVLVALRKALDDPDAAVRRNMVSILAKLGTDARESADDLGRLVDRETESEIRTEAIHALGAIEAKDKLKELFGKVKDPVLLVAVMDALAAAGGLDRSMADALVARGLRHTDATVRARALDCLRQVGLDTLRFRTIAELSLDDPSPKVRKSAAETLDKRMSQLGDADMEDVRALLGMDGKPGAVRIGLLAVRRLGPKAKEALPDLLKRLSAAEGKSKLELALAITAIDAKDTQVADAVGPLLVAALRPQTKDDKPDEAVLKAIGAIGSPVVDEIFKALMAADDRGAINANHRKALFLALQRLGREAYSEANVRILRRLQKKELYADVREAAGKAIRDMLPP